MKTETTFVEKDLPFLTIDGNVTRALIFRMCDCFDKCLEIENEDIQRQALMTLSEIASKSNVITNVTNCSFVNKA